MNASKQVIVNASAHAIPLPAGFFHGMVTSPPYYSLRQYAGEQLVDWPAVEYSPIPGLPPLTIPAQRAALGLEESPEAYTAHLVLIFREVWRTLRDDGIAWLNLGDSYTANAGAHGGRDDNQGGAGPRRKAIDGGSTYTPRKESPGLQAGNLLMLPHRVALALQADGWTVRNDNVWAKVAPMPESVAGSRWERHRIKVQSAPCGQHAWAIASGQSSNGHPQRSASGGITNAPDTIWRDCPGCDKCEATGGYVLQRNSWRHTRAHEFVFMLTKGMGYYANQEAVREDFADERMGASGAVSLPYSELSGRNDTLGGNGHKGLGVSPGNAGRNPRSVFTPSPESYSGAHYAVFPTSLIAPLVRASVPTRCCPVCGAAWAPVVERGESSWERRKADGAPMRYGAEVAANKGRPPSFTDDADRAAGGLGQPAETNLIGYRPTCTCNRDDSQPGWLLDPFVGSGTSLAVARECGVNAVGLDISAVYLDEHAKPRGCGLTPSRALEGLPLFGETFR